MSGNWAARMTAVSPLLVFNGKLSAKAIIIAEIRLACAVTFVVPGAAESPPMMPLMVDNTRICFKWYFYTDKLIIKPSANTAQIAPTLNPPLAPPLSSLGSLKSISFPTHQLWLYHPAFASSESTWVEVCPCSNSDRRINDFAEERLAAASPVLSSPLRYS